MTRARIVRTAEEPHAEAAGAVSARRSCLAPSGLDSVFDADLRAMLAGGELVGLGEDSPDRFRAQWDGLVFRVAADRRLIAVAASWPAILAAMDREADTAAGLDDVEEAKLRRLFAGGWVVAFTAAEGSDAGLMLATVSYLPPLPWRRARFPELSTRLALAGNAAAKLGER